MKRSRYSGSSRNTSAPTSTFSSAVARNTSGTLKPAPSMALAPSALTIMNSAFRMLLAAMMRARSLGWLRNWISAYIGTL